MKGKKEMATKLYQIWLTKEEIDKVVNLIGVVVEPLKKASVKAVIPKQKREAQECLDEVQGILNKFKIEEEQENEND